MSPKKKGGKQKSIEGAFKVQKVDKIDKAIKALDAKAQMWAPTTLAFAVPPETTKVAAGADASTLCTVDGMPASTAKMLVESATSTELGHMGAAQEKTKGVKAAKGDAWKPLALMRVSSSVVERRLAEAIARPLLSFAASGGLEKFGDWQPLKQAKGAAAWTLRPVAGGGWEAALDAFVVLCEAFEEVRVGTQQEMVTIRPDPALFIAGAKPCAHHMAASTLALSGIVFAPRTPSSAVITILD